MKTLATVVMLCCLAVVYPSTLSAGELAGHEKMMDQHKHDQPKATPAATTEPSQPVTGEETVYGEVGGKPLRGYVARPKNASGSLPGIIVIQEWWGLNDNIRAMTRRLAGEGYLALAVDLYGGEVATDPGKARELMTKALGDLEAGSSNIRAAHAWLERNGARKVGVIGWCFGGGWALETALFLPEIDATVMYYGRVVTEKDRLAALKSPLLGIFGAEDKGIPVEGVRAFEKALKELGKNAEIHVYEGADHAFANSSGGAYKADAAEDAWKRTVAFFKKHL